MWLGGAVVAGRAPEGIQAAPAPGLHCAPAPGSLARAVLLALMLAAITL